MLFPFMFAARILSSESSLAHTTDAVQTRLCRLSSVLLADVPRAIASSITTSELRIAIVTSCDVTLRLHASMLLLWPDRV